MNKSAVFYKKAFFQQGEGFFLAEITAIGLRDTYLNDSESVGYVAVVGSSAGRRLYLDLKFGHSRSKKPDSVAFIKHNPIFG
ncbi:hypothetical protein [Fibrella forsythiae]|uniref:Uncharacterized protein n=1 Tax=Fibrella forsythiae TaxID=2817061 RepID=A0ABS3JI34_9BACT|nr:hypothetical protein [Fibrella forsythiae]MBO0949063.1 hypothetical protein [Fibrella forsythiae]